MTDDLGLAEALRQARTGAGWAVPPRGLDVAAVRRAGRGRRRRNRAAVTGALAVAAAGAALLWQVQPGSRGATLQPAGPALGGGAAVAGISPAFTPTSGRDWLLDQKSYAAFEAGHVLPSPGPGQSVVPSPAPLTDRSAVLQSDVEAGLPPGASLRREDAPGGEPEVYAVHVQLADGSPVEVERRRLQVPRVTDSPVETGGPPLMVSDVPGSSSAVFSQSPTGYGFLGRSGESRMVAVVTSAGELTSWWCPDSVPLADLQRWALAAEAHAAASRH